MAHIERNQEATVYIGNLDERATVELVWELMVQAGPVVSVHMPKDRITQTHQGYGFCEFATEEDAEYAAKIMDRVKLFGKPLRVNKATADKKQQLDIGATLFIGNLDPDLDESTLYSTFSAFGPILQTPKIARDPDTGNSKGYAFVSFESFEASDAAIDAMNGQFLANKPISVSYAFKKDGKGERHGSAAERLLAAQAKINQVSRPPPPPPPQPPMMPGMPAMPAMPGMPAYNAYPPMAPQGPHGANFQPPIPPPSGPYM
ncbi:uncharacterized protein VTP21DRAFT_3995 [Calcarisporiella thermophila]|uniref:uncharacterized protein n=1 Tax=Calcarisporiella thermophila TaxID=911321 RepID=UPI00374428DC